MIYDVRCTMFVHCPCLNNYVFYELDALLLHRTFLTNYQLSLRNDRHQQCFDK